MIKNNVKKITIALRAVVNKEKKNHIFINSTLVEDMNNRLTKNIKIMNTKKLSYFLKIQQAYKVRSQPVNSSTGYIFISQ